MTIVNGYITQEEAVAYLGANATVETEEMDEIDDAITSVSRQIDHLCQRQFWQTDDETPVARTFSPSGWQMEFGPFNDLVSVTSVAFDTSDAGVYSETVTAYVLDRPEGPESWPYTGLTLTDGSFPTAEHRDPVRITGVWGWPEVPALVKQACRIQVARIVKRRESPQGVAGFGPDYPIRISTQLDPDVMQLLAPLRMFAGVGIA